MKTMKERIEDKIKDFLIKERISMVGIASLCHLPSVPDTFSPQRVLKNAASVICYGVPIPKGIMYADAYGDLLYWRYCNMTYRFLDVVSNNLCLLLEKEAVSVPVYGCYPWKIVYREFWGLIPLVYWAEQAGLGTLTKCGLLGTPEYGTRTLLGGVITTAELKPTNPLNEGFCPADCFKCIQACPVQAIDKSGKVDHNRCIRHANENPLLHNLLLHDELKEKYSFETLVNTVGVDDHGTYTCLECMRVCPFNR